MAGAAAPKKGNATTRNKNGGNANKPKNGNAINTNKNGGKAMSRSNSTTANGGNTNNGGRDSYRSCYSKFRHYIGITDKSENDTRDIFNVHFYDEVIVTTVADANTNSVVDRWIDDLDIESGDLVVGLDIEWVRLSESSERNKVDVLQLCSGDKCLIYQFLNNLDNQVVPKKLVKFLENDRIIFVGSGIDKKAHMLWADHGLYVARSQDLGSLADYKCPRRQDNLLYYKEGLKVLAWEVLKLDVPYGKDIADIALSRWDIGDCGSDKDYYLGSDQVLYACIDAYVSFRLGKKLIEDPDPPKKKGTNQGTKPNQGTNQGQGQGVRPTNQQGSEIGQPRKEEYAVRVDNLPEATRWGNLRDLFKPASRANVALDKETKKSLGYGYVNFEKKEDAEKAIHKFNGYRYEDHILTVGWKDGYSVRVNNLSDYACKDDLRELFKPYGDLVRVNVAVNKDTGICRGFGFVNFVYKEDAEYAISKLNGYGHHNRYIRVGWASPRAN